MKGSRIRTHDAEDPNPNLTYSINFNPTKDLTSFETVLNHNPKPLGIIR